MAFGTDLFSELVILGIIFAIFICGYFLSFKMLGKIVKSDKFPNYVKSEDEGGEMHSL